MPSIALGLGEEQYSVSHENHRVDRVFVHTFPLPV
jgi:hypothetical protein